MMAQQYRLALASLLGMSLALASSHAAAVAGSSVRASLSNAQLTVIDLTPRDGKAAGYTLPASAQSSGAITTIDLAGEAWDLRNEANKPNVSNSAAYSYHGGADIAARTGAWGQASTRMYADGDQLGPARVRGSAYQMIGVSVAAHTRLVYTGLAEITIGKWEQTADNTTFSGASLTVGLNGALHEFDFDSDQFSGSYGNSSKEFSLYFDNNTGADTMMWMTFRSVTSMDYYTTTPVPEPDTWAMLGLGALVVGAAARRRRLSAARA